MRSQCHWPVVTQGSMARECSRAALVYRDAFFVCELLAGVPEGRLASVCWVEGRRPRVCMSNRLKQVCSALCLTRPPEIHVCQPPLFLSLGCSFSPKSSWYRQGGVLPSFNFEIFNFLSAINPSSHLLAIAKGFNVLYYSE